MLLKNIMTTFLLAHFILFLKDSMYSIGIGPKRNELSRDSTLIIAFLLQEEKITARPDFHFICPGTHKSMGFGSKSYIMI